MFEIPLCKIDEEKRLVIGQAAAECRDKSGECMDYASAKAAFQKWSDEFHVSTKGLSKGNLRVMHTKEVAGKILDLTFDDDAKAVNVIAHVASDNAWNLVKSGCFSGFSIGGGYAKRWTDDAGLKKYTPIIREISLVDSPCIPTAMFAELIKADGIVEVIELKGRVRTFAQEWAERPAPVPTFADTWANRPQTFAELHKFDETKVHRNHGRFASSGKADEADEEEDDFEPSSRSHAMINAGAGAFGSAAGGSYVKARNYRRTKILMANGLHAGKGWNVGTGVALGTLAAEVAAQPLRNWADRRDGSDPTLYDPERDDKTQVAITLGGAALGAAAGYPLGLNTRATTATMRAAGKFHNRMGVAAARAGVAAAGGSNAKKASKHFLNPDAIFEGRVGDVERHMSRYETRPERPSVASHEVAGEIIPPPPRVDHLPGVERPKVADFDPHAVHPGVERLRSAGRRASHIWNGLTPKGRLAAAGVLGFGAAMVGHGVRQGASKLGIDPPPLLDRIGNVSDAALIGLYGAAGGVWGHGVGRRFQPVTRQLKLPSKKMFRVAERFYPHVGAGIGALAVGGMGAAQVAYDWYERNSAKKERAAAREKHAAAAAAQRSRRAQDLMGKLNDDDGDELGKLFGNKRRRKLQDDANEIFNTSFHPFWSHPDNSRVTNHEVGATAYHVSRAIEAFANGHISKDQAQALASSHVNHLNNIATARMGEEHELHSQLRDGLLTNAQHAQRVAAAQARWHKEGNPSEPLGKRYDNSKHPREHDGKFSSKTGEKVGRTIGGAAGAVGGAYLGLKHGANVGEKVGMHAAHAVNEITRPRGLGGLGSLNRLFEEGARHQNYPRIGRMLGGKYGAVIGGTALGLGGYLAGSVAGAGVDAHGRRRRAIKAGKLEQYERLNSDTSVLPSGKGQVKRAVAKTKTYANKAQRAHDFIKQAGSP